MGRLSTVIKAPPASLTTTKAQVDLGQNTSIEFTKDIVTINDVTIWVNNHKIFHKQNNKTFLPHMKKNFHKKPIQQAG